ATTWPAAEAGGRRKRRGAAAALAHCDLAWAGVRREVAVHPCLGAVHPVAHRVAQPPRRKPLVLLVANKSACSWPYRFRLDSGLVLMVGGSWQEASSVGAAPPSRSPQQRASWSQLAPVARR